jgi:uncharacterized protein YbcI
VLTTRAAQNLQFAPFAATLRQGVRRVSPQLSKRYYGKGPTSAKTYLVDDTVICMLRGGFTVVERTLIDAGRAQAVHDVRRSFQGSMQELFTAVVEEAVGRRVTAYMSQIHTDPDIALEVFALEPGEESARGEHEAEVDEHAD